jgi:integrase
MAASSKHKKANGEGSIYQRKDGRWVGQLSLSDGGRKFFYGATRREVKERLTAAQHDQQRGLPVLNERELVADFLARWLADVAKPKLRPMTYHRYQDLLRLHVLPSLGKRPLARLTPQDVQTLLTAKLGEGLAPATVVQIRAVLRRALGQALKWGLVARNTAALTDPPRMQRAEVQPFSPEQARAFLAAVQGDRLEALYTVAVALGLRSGEARGLRWEDLDLDGATLRVRYALQKIDKEFQLVEPKTVRSRRTIDLPPVAVASLRRHKARQNEDRLRAGEAWQDWGLVFTTSIGTPLDATNVGHYFHRIIKRAELPRIRFHDLRHTAASLLLAQGVHPRLVMEILGHSQIALTMNTYSHVMPTLRKEVAVQMEAILTAEA